MDVTNGFSPRYLTIKGKGDVIKELKAAAKSASEVYLATDPDREGEAIAWHLAELLKLENPKRIELHEITKDAALAALKDAHPIDMPRVNAQQARRILDRLVGYKISPLLWAKVRGGLSAGRVQSVAVRLIVDREREIRAFVPREYWTITAQLLADRVADRVPAPTWPASTARRRRSPTASKPPRSWRRSRARRSGSRRSRRARRAATRPPRSPPRPCSKRPRASSSSASARRCSSRRRCTRASTWAARRARRA